MFAAMQFVYQQHVRTLQQELCIPLLAPFINLCRKLSAVDSAAKQEDMKPFEVRWAEGLERAVPASFVDENVVSVVLKRQPMAADVLKDAIITHRRMMLAGKHPPKGIESMDQLLQASARDMFVSFCKMSLTAATQKFRAEPGLFELADNADIASARRDRQLRIIYEAVACTIEKCDDYTVLCSGMLWKDDGYDVPAVVHQINGGDNAQLLSRVDRLCNSLDQMAMSGPRGGAQSGSAGMQREEHTALIEQIRAQISNLVASVSGMSQNVRVVKEAMVAARVDEHACHEAAVAQRNQALQQMEDSSSILLEQLDKHARVTSTKLEVLDATLRAGMEATDRSTQLLCNELRSMNGSHAEPSSDYYAHATAGSSTPAPGAAAVVSSLPSPFGVARPHAQHMRALATERSASTARSSGEWISAAPVVAADTSGYLRRASSRPNNEGEPSLPPSSNASAAAERMPAL
jgi:hypothetical protein